ncbi:hypothetical protein RQP46_007659 [Phenoliferia psychrophenolica]
MSPSGPTPFTSIPIGFSQESAMQAADRRARARFLEALLAGFGIWVLLGMLTGSIVESEQSQRRHRGSGGWTAIRRPLDHTIKCNGFTAGAVSGRGWLASAATFHPVSALVMTKSSTTKTATSTFTLPISESDTLFLHGRGSWSHGSAVFKVDDSLGWDVVADVVAKYNQDGLLEDSDICQVRERFESGYNSGLVISTPTQNGQNDYYDQLTFSVTYRIPSSLASLHGLNISTSIFTVSSQSLPRLSSLRIVTTNAPITLDAVVADTIYLQTTNAPVRVGTAEAKRSITVRSSNGRVEGAWKAPETDVRTSNAAVSGDFEVGKSLGISTTNLGVNAKVALVGGEAFDVVAKTTNGVARVEYTEQPRGSRLTSEVSTSNLPATASSSFFGVKVTGPLTLKDPSSMHRERHIEVSSTGSKEASGTVWWSSSEGGKDKDRDSRGSTSVKTSNAPVEVQFL